MSRTFGVQLGDAGVHNWSLTWCWASCKSLVLRHDRLNVLENHQRPKNSSTQRPGLRWCFQASVPNHRAGQLRTGLVWKHRFHKVDTWRDHQQIRRFLTWLVVEPTHLKNISENGFIFPNFRGEHKKSLKPPPSDSWIASISTPRCGGKQRWSFPSSVSHWIFLGGAGGAEKPLLTWRQFAISSSAFTKGCTKSGISAKEKPPVKSASASTDIIPPQMERGTRYIIKFDEVERLEPKHPVFSWMEMVPFERHRNL